jgi:hypothetical protein
MKRRTEGNDDLEDYLVYKLEPTYDSLGFYPSETEEDYLNERLRTLIVADMCRLGYEDCELESNSLFSRYIKDWTLILIYISA